jgi:hypothetical protein
MKNVHLVSSSHIQIFIPVHDPNSAVDSRHWTFATSNWQSELEQRIVECANENGKSEYRLAEIGEDKKVSVCKVTDNEDKRQELKTLTTLEVEWVAY